MTILEIQFWGTSRLKRWLNSEADYSKLEYKPSDESERANVLTI